MELSTSLSTIHVIVSSRASTRNEYDRTHAQILQPITTHTHSHRHLQRRENKKKNIKKKPKQNENQIKTFVGWCALCAFRCFRLAFQNSYSRVRLIHFVFSQFVLFCLLLLSLLLLLVVVVLDVDVGMQCTKLVHLSSNTASPSPPMRAMTHSLMLSFSMRLVVVAFRYAYVAGTW